MDYQLTLILQWADQDMLIVTMAVQYLANTNSLVPLRKYLFGLVK